MSGLTAAGLSIKTEAEIIEELEQALIGAFGAGINLSPQSVFGQVVGISSEREALLWELLQDIYDSQYPDSATGISLDRVGALTSLPRLGALPSLITTQALFGTPGTVIPAGVLIAIANNETVQFSTDEIVTLVAGTDEVQTISFDLLPNSGTFQLAQGIQVTTALADTATATDVQDALNALSTFTGVVVTGNFTIGFTVTFASADGKQPQDTLAFLNNTLQQGVTPVVITIATPTPGVYQGTTPATAVVTGPTLATQESITVIVNPIAGFTSTLNAVDSIIGRNEETDAEYRIRRNNRLQISKAGPAEAIRSAILDLNEIEGSTEIESVIVFENTTLFVDAQGRPGKSFEAYVFETNGTSDRDQEVADTIYLRAKPAGIEPFGTVSKTVTDSQGFNHTSKFSRPVEVDIFLELDLTVSLDYPSDGDNQVSAIMVSHGNGLGVGVDVIVSPTLIAQLAAVPGITDVVVRIGKLVSPTLDDNIVIDDGTGSIVEISRWDASRVAVTQL